MPRRLIVLFDGTWNKVQTQTNVERMHKLVAPADASGNAQLSLYIEGVGVKPGLTHLLGGAFGLGLSANIEQGYRWLCQNWKAGDEIFLFGFSRGAYTARSAAGLIHKCGLLKPDAKGEVTQKAVEEAYNFYRNDIKPGDPRAAAWRAQHSLEVPIHFIGVWDTVGALGIPDVASWFPFSRKRYRFHDTELSSSVRYAYHALALDEHRADFAPTKWTRLPSSLAPGENPTEKKASQIDVEQRWFIGCHSDVGGGEKSDGAGKRPDPLPDLPLAWMQAKAAEAGLAFTGTFQPRPDAELGTPNDSYAHFMFGIYKVFKQPFNRRIGGGVNETIDQSVWRRWREVAGYRPPTLASALDDGVVSPPSGIA
ncbi:MAG TPA: DUF2235 domain-containing protein [Rhodanobacteraceae bacterium]|nr:DUF2235 domain-containing protein [Rhodanobacteraceae bacterium]